MIRKIPSTMSRMGHAVCQFKAGIYQCSKPSRPMPIRMAPAYMLPLFFIGSSGVSVETNWLASPVMGYTCAAGITIQRMR